MTFTAYSRDTGLSQDYLIDASPLDEGRYGVLVTIREPATGKPICQWRNPRQNVDDMRPFDMIIDADPRAVEILAYFSR